MTFGIPARTKASAETVTMLRGDAPFEPLLAEKKNELA